jgi:hypothetical protein
MHRSTLHSLIQRRTSASKTVTLRWAKRRNLRVVRSANSILKYQVRGEELCGRSA